MHLREPEPQAGGQNPRDVVPLREADHRRACRGTEPLRGCAMTSTDLDLYLRLSDLREDDLNDNGRSKGLVEMERLLREYVTRLGRTVGQVIVENDVDENGKP